MPAKIFIVYITIIGFSTAYANEIIQLTNTSCTPGVCTESHKPTIAKGRIAWHQAVCQTEHCDAFIQLFENNQTTNIYQLIDEPDYRVGIYNAVVSDDAVVWIHDRPQRDLMFFNGSNSQFITNNTTSEQSHSIYKTTVVWSEPQTGIMRYKSGIKTQISTNSTASSPSIDQNWIVWMERDPINNDLEIFLHDGWNITRITNDSMNNEYPDISYPYIVWQRHDGNDYEIIQYNMQTGLEKQITNNQHDDKWPKNYSHKITWESQGDIYFFDGLKSFKISNDGSDISRNPDIYDSIVVWEGKDSHAGATGYDVNYEIFMTHVFPRGDYKGALYKWSSKAVQ